MSVKDQKFVRLETKRFKQVTLPLIKYAFTFEVIVNR